ncbi:nucleoside hydrolase [Salinibacillus aidingensis]|uniref:Nucleoside hydrolase n=1 Tax=Salinibacillus aidingensis TaxID=237684 RepID=A0ABP3KSS2_9BACI
MKKVILDMDTGIDDALAIAYAVAKPELEILGITTVYGTAPVEYTYRNTVKVLESVGEPLPVRKGSDKPRERIREYNGKIHGMDGLGETLGELKEDGLVPSQHAVDFIIEETDRCGEDLTIVTTGPLTNLAAAIEKSPAIMKKVGKIVTMGGAVATPGNVSKFAEANIAVDPEAADIVFKSKLPVTLVGLDVTRKTLLTDKDVEKWRQLGTPTAELFASFTQFYLHEYKKLHPYLEGCALHDPLAVGVALYPDLVNTVPMHIEVDKTDEALGRTVENLHVNEDETPNTQVCFQVDAQAFMDDFFGTCHHPNFVD